MCYNKYVINDNGGGLNMIKAEHLNSNKDIEKCSIGDIIVILYKDGKMLSSVISKKCKDKLIVKSTLHDNYVEEEILIDLEYNDHIIEIVRVYNE